MCWLPKGRGGWAAPLRNFRRRSMRQVQAVCQQGFRSADPATCVRDARRPEHREYTYCSACVHRTIARWIGRIVVWRSLHAVSCPFMHVGIVDRAYVPLEVNGGAARSERLMLCATASAGAAWVCAGRQWAVAGVTCGRPAADSGGDRRVAALGIDGGHLPGWRLVWRIRQPGWQPAVAGDGGRHRGSDRVLHRWCPIAPRRPVSSFP